HVEQRTRSGGCAQLTFASQRACLRPMCVIWCSIWTTTHPTDTPRCSPPNYAPRSPPPTSPRPSCTPAAASPAATTTSTRAPSSPCPCSSRSAPPSPSTPRCSSHAPTSAPRHEEAAHPRRDGRLPGVSATRRRLERLGQSLHTETPPAQPEGQTGGVSHERSAGTLGVAPDRGEDPVEQESEHRATSSPS